MAWTIAPCLVVLRDEVNARWPDRDTASDGFIGDAAHAATPSDHNPNGYGVVCAFDITHDPAHGCDIAALYDFLRAHPHPDQKYIIANGRIASRQYQWTDRPYTKDPHTSHIHVSVGVGTDGQSAPGTYNNTASWLTGFGTAPTEDDVTKDEHDALFEIRNAVVASWAANDSLVKQIAALEKKVDSLQALSAGELPVSGTLKIG